MATEATENIELVPETEARKSVPIIGSDAHALTVAREVAARLKEHAALRDRERKLPHDEIELFSSSGLWGITVPKEYGGAEVSNVTLAEVIAIVSEADPSIGQIPQNHYCLIEDIRLEGTEEQKRFFFDLVLKGTRYGNAFSEAGGKNVLDIQTRIRRDGDGFVLNGRKFYSTGTLFAHWIPVLALDEQDEAVLAFVKQGTPGLAVIDDWSGFGQRTTASGTVVAENVRVGPFEIFHTQRSYDRPTFAGPFAQITTAAIDLGIARAALHDTIEFVQQHARPWIDSGVERAAQDPLTIAQIGDLAYRIHAAEALLERSGRFVDVAKREPTEESVAHAAIAVGEAKIATTEVALLAASKLFELGGSKSTLAKYNFDRHWRNARVHTLHDPVRWKYHAIGNYYLNGVKPARHSWN
ncbi:SfnB family sulfur acquisition oxidoreductase [Paraburkholderia caballeronis]|uniref:SfnB family sulfur acquisition oxidoreductase n=1 Tax=Paraburkholderia caballeronis TaxID=416943 RepID=UPI0010E60BCF|nr:SfnB family sulfur acquisition oxidoreductase [Paraburkholderia caballeronis]TDV06764.1 SfnB family sulfur acquisition oxidoreductase [Paraburkholderia caballeronis]TDV09944.1 SfnB family sulfur acquisition oxidoreductase [Paraburkholderia caballeronis]TDV21776.1 SfnB family sulfur acquisition oxidoreductase [Paraburkholderia caballeronis]